MLKNEVMKSYIVLVNENSKPFQPAQWSPLKTSTEGGTDLVVKANSKSAAIEEARKYHGGLRGASLKAEQL